MTTTVTLDYHVIRLGHPSSAAEIDRAYYEHRLRAYRREVFRLQMMATFAFGGMVIVVLAWLVSM